MSDEKWEVLLGVAVEAAFEEGVKLQALMDRLGFELAWQIDTHNKRPSEKS